MITFPTPADKLIYEKAKKGIMTLRIVFLSFILIFSVLGLAFNNGFFILSVIFALSYIIVIPRERLKLRRSFCPVCHAHYDYAADIDVTETRRTFTSTDTNAKGVSILRFDCRCHSCSHIRSFTKKITSAKIDSNGKVDFYNLSHISKNMFV